MCRRIVYLFIIEPFTKHKQNIAYTVHKGFTGASLGDDFFSDLDYADDVALLAEMLEVFIPSLEIMQNEANPFGLEFNWSKTKIQTTIDTSVPQQVQVAGNTEDIVKSFTYLGSLIDRSGRCEAELVRRIAIARNCMTQLIATSGFPVYLCPPRFASILRIYTASILYGAETWTITKTMSAKVDAFDQWCLRRILYVSTANT